MNMMKHEVTVGGVDERRVEVGPKDRVCDVQVID